MVLREGGREEGREGGQVHRIGARMTIQRRKVTGIDDHVGGREGGREGGKVDGEDGMHVQRLLLLLLLLRDVERREGSRNGGGRDADGSGSRVNDVPIRIIKTGRGRGVSEEAQC